MERSITFAIVPEPEVHGPLPQYAQDSLNSVLESGVVPDESITLETGWDHRDFRIGFKSQIALWSIDPYKVFLRDGRWMALKASGTDWVNVETKEDIEDMCGAFHYRFTKDGVTEL